MPLTMLTKTSPVLISNQYKNYKEIKNKKDEKVYNKWLFMILLVPLYGYMILRQKLPENGFIGQLIPDFF